MPSRNAEARHVTDEPETRNRFSLYRLCHCPTCEGSGKEPRMQYERHPNDPEDVVPIGHALERCRECRGEGRIRDEIASCDSPEAVGVALVTLARQGEWIGEDGNPCPLGLLDREGEKGKKWLILPWQASPRNVHDAAVTLARSRKVRPTG